MNQRQNIVTELVDVFSDCHLDTEEIIDVSDDRFPEQVMQRCQRITMRLMCLIRAVTKMTKTKRI